MLLGDRKRRAGTLRSRLKPPLSCYKLPRKLHQENSLAALLDHIKALYSAVWLRITHWQVELNHTSDLGLTADRPSIAGSPRPASVQAIPDSVGRALPGYSRPVLRRDSSSARERHTLQLRPRNTDSTTMERHRSGRTGRVRLRCHQGQAT